MLLLRREAAREQLHALERAVGPVVVGRGVAERRLVVPVDERAGGRVDRLRMRLRRLEAAPLEGPGAVGGQAEIDARGPDRQAARREVGDVAVVGVGPVEPELDLVHHPQEVLRRVHAAAVEVGEGAGADELAPVGRALLRDRNAAAVHVRVADDRAVHGGAEAEHAVGRALDDAGVEEAHRPALALVQVVRVVAVAERLDVLVDDVRVRGGRAPGVVGPAADHDPGRPGNMTPRALKPPPWRSISRKNAG